MWLLPLIWSYELQYDCRVISEGTRFVHSHTGCVHVKIPLLMCAIRLIWECELYICPENMFHNETYLYNFDLLKPHFYKVKLGFTKGIHYLSYFC